MDAFGHPDLADGKADMFDRFGALDDALTDPTSLRVIGVEPDARAVEAAQFRTQLEPAQQARFLAIKDRLVRLGYLDTVSAAQAQSPTPAFDLAVRKLQTDAAIKVDDWVGPQTWAVLQAAFAVEGEPDIRQHLMTAGPQGTPTALAWRAGLLRLLLVGLVGPKDYAAWRANPDATPDRDPTGGEARQVSIPAFNRLRSVLMRLKMPGIEAISEDDYTALLKLVIDFDGLTTRLAQCPKPDDKTLRRAKVKDLLGKAITIELWARGFDLPVAQPAQLKRRTPVPYPIDRLAAALESYFKCEQFTTRSAASRTRRALKNFPDLFARFNADRNVPRRTADSTIEDKVERYFTQNPDDFKKGLARLARLGAWLWDGVRRVAGWVARVFKKSLESIKAVFSDTLDFFMRLGHRMARDGFHALRRARDLLVESTAFFTQRSHVLADEGIAWHRGLDGDFSTVIEPGKAALAVAQLNQETLRAKIVRLAGQLVSAALSVVRTLATSAAGGWLRFWLMLMRVARRAGPWLKQADALWYQLYPEQRPKPEDGIRPTAQP